MEAYVVALRTLAAMAWVPSLLWGAKPTWRVFLGKQKADDFRAVPFTIVAAITLGFGLDSFLFPSTFSRLPLEQNIYRMALYTGWLFAGVLAGAYLWKPR